MAKISFNFGANRKPPKAKKPKNAKKSKNGAGSKSNAWRAYVGSNEPIPD